MQPNEKTAKYVLFLRGGYQYRAKLNGRTLETICKRVGPLRPWKRITNAEISKLKPTILKERAYL